MCVQEASLLKSWVEVEEAKVAAAEAAAAVEDEEDADVGPTLPGQALINKAKANMGGFLLPGEGDRCGASGSVLGTGAGNEHAQCWEHVGSCASGRVCQGLRGRPEPLPATPKALNTMCVECQHG